MKKRPNHIAVVLGGGKGLRYGSSVPKQYKVLAGKPLIAHALMTINSSPEVDMVFVVANQGDEERMRELVIRYGISKCRAIICGGASRQESVRNALEYINANDGNDYDIVLIQDGDRPNIDERMIKENFEAATKYGAAVTAFPSTDSIFVSNNGETVSKYIDRRKVYAVQTPQTFKLSLILSAHREFKDTIATDDASLVRRKRHKVVIVQGDSENYKINTLSQGKAFAIMKERKEEHA